MKSDNFFRVFGESVFENNRVGHVKVWSDLYVEAI